MNKKQIEAALQAENSAELFLAAFEEKETVINQLTEQNNQLTEKNQELTTQLEEAKKDPDTLKRCPKTFKVGKKEYRFKQGVLRVHVSHRVYPEAPGIYEAEKVAGMKDLREELVKINYGGLEEVPQK